MATVPLVMRLVANSLCVSNRAAGIIRQILSSGQLGIVEKEGKHDLQTEADRSAQKCIMASLKKGFPNVKVIGEEGELDESEAINPDWLETSMSEDVLQHQDRLPQDLKDVKDEEVVVWIDPVDGTAEYTQGLLDHVTVLIGVGVRGKAVGGVICQPYYNYKAGPDAKLGRAIWGVIGIGAFGFEPTKPPGDENIITTTRSHSTKGVQEAVQACEPTQVLRVGGAGHKVLLLIEGRAHAYVFASPGCKKWDTCAPEAVLHAMGGKLTDIHGNSFRYSADVKHKNTGGVLATLDAGAHQWYNDKIPQEIKDGLTPS